MTEKIVKVYKCGRCNKSTEIEIKQHIIMVNPGKPKGWGTKNNVDLCDKCINEYETSYQNWFNNTFMKQK